MPRVSISSTFGSSGTIPKLGRITSSKSSHTGTTGDSCLSRRRTMPCKALGTSGTQATGITFTSGTGRPAGQPARPTTGWVDQAFGSAPSAVG